MGINLQTYTGGPVACNAYLIEGKDGYLAIDAPLGFTSWVQQHLPSGAKLIHLLITHQHFDHVQDAALLRQQTGCQIHAYAPYSDTLTLERESRSWGYQLGIPPFLVDDAFGNRSMANWGGLNWRLCHIPGHATDGMAYILPEEKMMFVGDILFAGSIGRTDFPGGSASRLVQGIRQQLMAEDPGSVIYCGHGPSTTLEEEMLNNPYLT